MNEKDETIAQSVKIHEIGGGAVVEMFDEALKEVLDNMFDLNKDGKKARKITITFSFIPTKLRDACNYDIKCESSLAPDEAYSNMLYMGRSGDDLVACERDTSQIRFDFEDKAKNVKELKQMKGGEK